MARQPIENLQGYGQTSQSASRPVDTYTGAPAIPQETPGSQLANALGAFSGSVARASARNAAKKEQEEKQLAELKARIFAEQSQDYVGQVQLGKAEPALSVVAQASIAEEASRSKSYRATVSLLQNILSDDDIVGNKEEVDSLIAEHRASLVAATEGKPFVGAGVIKGFDNAVLSQTPSILKRQGALLRAAGRQAVTDAVPEVIQSIDADSPTAISSIWKALQAKDGALGDTFPNGKTERVARWREGIVDYSIATGDKRPLELLLLGWLKETDDTTYKAAVGKVDAIQTKAYFDTMANKEKERKANIIRRKQEINISLAEGTSLDPVEMSKEEPEVYDYWFSQSTKTALNEGQSSTDKRNFSDTIEAAYISGNFSFLGEREGNTGVPSDDEIYGFLDNLNLRPEHIEELKKSIDEFSEGYDALTDSDVKMFYDLRTGSRVEELLKKRAADDEVDWDVRLDPKNDIKAAFIKEYNRQWKAWYKSNPNTTLPPGKKEEYLKNANAVANEQYNGFLDIIDPPKSKDAESGTPGTTELRNDQFDRKQGIISLDANQVSAISEALKGESSLSESNVMEIIAKVLQVEDNEDYIYGGVFDSADEPGEVALKELVENYTEK